MGRNLTVIHEPRSRRHRRGGRCGLCSRRAAAATAAALTATAVTPEAPPEALVELPGLHDVRGVAGDYAHGPRLVEVPPPVVQRRVPLCRAVVPAIRSIKMKENYVNE